MLSDNTLICPVDGVLINETKVRLVAGLVLLTALTYGLTGWELLPLLLTVDIGLRSFGLGPYSPFGNGAGWLVKTFRLPYKGTGQAPKRFAARVGLGLGVLITGLHLAGIFAFTPTAVLALFAALESTAGR